MSKGTFEILEGFKGAPTWSKVMMYAALAAIGVLSYFGSYFYFWNIAISAVIGLLTPFLMLLFQSHAITQKIEDDRPPHTTRAITWSVLTIIPIAGFAFFGMHALGVHVNLQKEVNKEMGCLSDKIEEAVIKYQEDKASLLASAPVTLGDQEYLDEIQGITAKLDEKYQPFSIGNVLKDAEEVPEYLELFYEALSQVDSTSIASPMLINRESILNDINSLKAGWSEQNAIIIFVLVLLSFSPIMVVPAPRRNSNK